MGDVVIPFLHGGNRRAFAKHFGLQESEIVDFSSNGNPWGPPQSLFEVYQDSFHLLTSYPDPESLLLKKEIARNFPLWPENVIAANGATELIYLLIQFLKPRRALLVEPTFLEYRRALNLHGVEVRNLLLREKNDFLFSFAELSNAARDVGMVFLSSPNNPTGALASRSEVLAFLEEMKRREVFVVLDEAFIDWIPEESLANVVSDSASFFIIRSLTKFFNLPGIRIGYGLGSKRLIERLEKTKITWSVNNLAETLGVQALRDKEFQKHSRENLAKEKDFFFKELAVIEDLKAFPSAANFFLVKLRGSMRSGGLVECLAREKIMIRDASNFVGLDNQFFRVAVRNRKDNELLLESLKKIFQTTHA